MRDDSAINGATSQDYVLTQADTEARISARVTYDGTTLISTPTQAITNLNDAPVGAIVVNGAAIEDQTLTASTADISDADGLGSFSYSWLRSGDAIEGASGSSYTLTQMDVGNFITVEVTYTDGSGQVEKLTSRQTGPIANVNDAVGGTLIVGGGLREGEQLTVDPAITDEDGLGPIFYQWFRDGAAVRGQTGATYTLGADTLLGGDGADTLNGGDGNDEIVGGASGNDLRDVVFGGNGNDTADGGYGNDELRGDAGNDQLAGGFGADTLIGGTGDDTLTGSALGDLLFGGDGDDFVNGGFGFDRMNGGTGTDDFFHLGIASHGSDWIQDYNSTEGDVLLLGNGSATRTQFQINEAFTPGAGDADVADAFIIYRPTGQIVWALVDGTGQGEINLQLDQTCSICLPKAAEGQN